MNMQALMAQAQKMQRDIQKKKDEIDKKEFVGKSELIEVKMNGKKEILSVDIKKDINLDSDDIELLEDMFKIATNDAMKQIDKELSDKLGSYGNQLNGLI